MHCIKKTDDLMRLNANNLAHIFFINNNPVKAANKAEDECIQLLIFAC